MSKTFILLKDNFIQSFRSKKTVLFLIIYMAVFFLIANAIITFIPGITATIQIMGSVSQEANFAEDFVGSMFQGSMDASVLSYLFSIPLINIALFIVSIFGTPILILLTKYDLLALESYDHTFRFLLFRTSRFKIYLSRFLSAFLEIFAITFLALIFALIWSAIRVPDFSFSKSLSAGLYFLIVSQFLFAVIIAITMLMSTIVKKPLTALLFTFLALIVLLAVTNLVNYVSPFDSFYIRGLIAGFSLELLKSIISYILFTALFLAAGFIIFKRKNL